jgi:hypothetical protein
MQQVAAEHHLFRVRDDLQLRSMHHFKKACKVSLTTNHCYDFGDDGDLAYFLSAIFCMFMLATSTEPTVSDMIEAVLA